MASAYGKRKPRSQAEEQETSLFDIQSPGSHIYFVLGFAPKTHKPYIYIGYSAGAKAGRSTHVETGEILAFIRADKTHETALHNYYNEKRAPKGLFTSKDWFEAEIVRPYISTLLDNHYAVSTEQQLCAAGKIAWEMWAPQFIQKRPRGFFTICEEYLVKARDTYQTPMYIVQAAQEALGGQIDLDPATSFEAHNNMIQAGCGPLYAFTEHTNGLTVAWQGSIFLNPPYGEKSKEFTMHLVEEIKNKHVKAAVIVLSLEHTTTEWFKKMHKALLPKIAWAIPYDRIKFIIPRTLGTKTDSPITGNIIVYYGPDKQRFWRAFYEIAYPLQLVDLDI